MFVDLDFYDVDVWCFYLFDVEIKEFVDIGLKKFNDEELGCLNWFLINVVFVCEV